MSSGLQNRIGLVNAKDVLKTELALMEVLPEDRWSRTHHSLIFHGRNCCAARSRTVETAVSQNTAKSICNDEMGIGEIS